MIIYKSGDIFTEKTNALINPINCVGVLGRGLALQFKKNYPSNYKAYLKVCENKKLRPGKMFVFDMIPDINPRYIINFPTKYHWRESSKLEHIELGLISLCDVINKYKIESIALPAIGCGLGKLFWCDVQKLIEEKLKHLCNIEIIIFQPKEF